MKKVILTSVFAFALAIFSFGQNTREINSDNSWLKLGVNAGLPVGKVADYSTFVLGVDLKGQFLTTPNWGVGVATGYNHFFTKDGVKNFGNVPVGLFARYYPAPTGFFAGLDAGYAFLTNTGSNDGGFYLKPQLGYHNYDWNIFGYYNNVFRASDKGGNIPSVGVGFTYNIRFN